MDDILLLVVPPAVEPVTLVQAKVQAHVETADEDASIGALITAARAYVEETTGRALVSQTWGWQHMSWGSLFKGGWSRMSRNAWGSKVIMPRRPLQSVVSITYLDVSNTPHTLPATEYVVSPGDPGTIEPSSTFSWPEIAAAGYPITITFVAGYGKVPATLTQAILLLVKDWYDERGAIITGSRAQVAALPHAVEALLNLYRWSL